jgi:hypothetical protein
VWLPANDNREMEPTFGRGVWRLASMRGSRQLQQDNRHVSLFIITYWVKEVYFSSIPISYNIDFICSSVIKEFSKRISAGVLYDLLAL